MKNYAKDLTTQDLETLIEALDLAEKAASVMVMKGMESKIKGITITNESEIEAAIKEIENEVEEKAKQKKDEIILLKAKLVQIKIMKG